MQTAIAEQEPHPRPFTVAEYYHMAEVGIIGPDERVELLDGQVIVVPPIGPLHGADVMSLTKLFFHRFPDDVLVSVQSSLRLDDMSEPEPDLIVLPGPATRYREAHPTPADALIVVEVAMTSLAYDRGRKRAAYARTGVQEYWIVDLAHDEVEVYWDPENGEFRETRILVRGESFAPQAFPDVVFTVDELLLSPA
jgi:Uma2 family endonuclease